MKTLFHIANTEDWIRSQTNGIYECASLQKEGFIHCSLPHQIKSVADYLFKGQNKLVLLQINQDFVNAAIKYEGSENNKFPHIYGPLNLNSVVEVFNFSENQNGFHLPETFQLIGDTLIRPALLGDDAEITNVHIHAWQQAYKDIINPDFLDSLPLQFHKRHSWWKSVLQGKTTTKVFVAESSQHGVVGFIALDRGRDPELSTYGEITAIYCLKEYKNKGIGSALFKKGISYLSLQQYDKGYLWVLEKNPTCLFYERMGGKLLPNKKTIEIGIPLVEVAYGWNF